MDARSLLESFFQSGQQMAVLAGLLYLLLPGPGPVHGQDQPLEPGAVETVNLPGGVQLELVWIPPGSFQMGCTGRKKDCDDQYELPVHSVTLDGFWIGKHELTQEQWQAVMGENPSQSRGGSQLPVENVSWQDVQAFLARTGGGLRLPTEAEWEYAARGGTQGLAHGDLEDIAWHQRTGQEPPDPSFTPGPEQPFPPGLFVTAPRPVGGKQPNAYGVHDMLGNVEEWCSDSYARYAPMAQTNPKVESGSVRVLRGGSYVSREIKVSTRAGREADDYNGRLGFRVARSVGARSEPEASAASAALPPHAEAAAEASGSELAPGTVRTVMLPGGLELELAWIPPGTFEMGCTGRRNECKTEHDLPVHTVTLDGFWIGKTEVTQAQWQALMGDNPSEHRGPDHPVESITWDEAQQFLEKAGQGLRLPTEAEWEYAARGGTRGIAYGPLEDIAVPDTVFHAAAGTKQPNAYGLHDMIGNVREWCSDHYHSPYPSAAQTNPKGPKSGQLRVMRGSGSVSARSGRPQDDAQSYLGFRVASGALPR